MISATGIASSLFFSSNDTEKQTLHRRITPSAEQIEEQQDRWNELAKHLVADLQDETGCSVQTWLQGSYKFGTQIRPPRQNDEFDIDLGIFVCWPGLAQNGSHKPEDLRRVLQKSLGLLRLNRRRPQPRQADETALWPRPL